MTSNAELIAEVIAYNADAEDSHYDVCYQRHAGCLAVMLRDMLREPGAPDAATDVREYLHAKCDCVPDLGPAHCHLCTGEGSPVNWEDCEAVREIADVSEPVEVVLTTADIEGLAHLLVQLSPATQKNSGATIRRLLREMNIKEVDQ